MDLPELIPLRNPFEFQQILGTFEQCSNVPYRSPRAGIARPAGSYCAYPIEQLCRGRRFFEPMFPQAVEFREARIEEPARYIRKVQSHDDRYFLGTRKRDVVAKTAAQKGIGEFSFGVAGDDYDGLVNRRYLVIDFPNDKRAIFKNIEQVILSIRIGLIDLIEQEHSSIFGEKRSAYWSETKVIPDVVNVSARFPTPEPGIVQSEHRVIDVAKFLPFECGLAACLFHVCAKRPRDFESKLCFPGPGFTHQKEWLFHRNGYIYDLAQFRAKVITLRTFELHVASSSFGKFRLRASPLQHLLALQPIYFYNKSG
jgi:hypothetical protein